MPFSKWNNITLERHAQNFMPKHLRTQSIAGVYNMLSVHSFSCPEQPGYVSIVTSYSRCGSSPFIICRPRCSSCLLPPLLQSRTCILFHTLHVTFSPKTSAPWHNDNCTSLALALPLMEHSSEETVTLWPPPLKNPTIFIKPFVLSYDFPTHLGDICSSLSSGISFVVGSVLPPFLLGAIVAGIEWRRLFLVSSSLRMRGVFLRGRNIILELGGCEICMPTSTALFRKLYTTKTRSSQDEPRSVSAWKSSWELTPLAGPKQLASWCFTRLLICTRLTAMHWSYRGGFLPMLYWFVSSLRLCFSQFQATQTL